MERKIAFFDIDGTLTSEIDSSIPDSAVQAIRQARKNGHLMFINTGRCLFNLEERFREIGFDGYVCGCGTNIYCKENDALKELLYVKPSPEAITLIRDESRKYHVDTLFESKKCVLYDNKRPFFTKAGKLQVSYFIKRGYDMTLDPDSEDFTFDKFVMWFENIDDLASFRKVSDLYFSCIDRGENFREFVPHGYSKATGIQAILDYYHLSLENAYAFGDSNNDLSMLSYVPHSIAMGNSSPASLFEQVTYVTTNSSENGIKNALEHFHFI